MKAFIPFLVGIVLSINSLAQQDIQVSNFDYLKSFYNPASITNTEHICGGIIGRNQWSGLNGRPNTGVLNGTYNFSNLIWGNILFAKDVIGLQNSNLLKLGIAKSFRVNRTVSISFGLNLNYSHFNWTSSYVTPDTPVPDDNSIPNNDVSKGNFDMDAGIFIKSNNLSIGISSTHLSEPTLKDPSFNFDHKRHYYVLCGYNIQRNFGTFENFLLAKSDVASTQIDIKFNFWHNKNWMVGLAYRVSDAIIPMVGIQKTLGRLSLRGIYSYDITTSKLNNYSSGSHEICIKMCLAPVKFTERYTHPRHLGKWK